MNAQATLAAALTRERENADNQAAATAGIVRANAQAILNSANATLRAVQTQDQNNADAIVARIAVTAGIIRAVIAVDDVDTVWQMLVNGLSDLAIPTPQPTIELPTSTTEAPATATP